MTAIAHDDLGQGATHYRGLLPQGEQKRLAATVLKGAEKMGWLQPVTPGGHPFSVRQTNFGPLGWLSDRRGYRYEAAHPETGHSWPPLPDLALALWQKLIPEAPPPECCLVNHYPPKARMGLHKDADEEDQTTPILSISLGQPARFRIGGTRRGGPTRSVIMQSGDAIILAGASRRAYHGIDRLLPAIPLLTPEIGIEGRLNLTLRRVTVDVPMGER